jgi:hypothetical protein
MQCTCAILSSVACSTTFSTLSHVWHDLRKPVIGHKICVLSFSTTFILNISHSKKNWARYKNIHWSSCKVPNSCRILIKLEYSRQIFEKRPNIIFHENPFNGSRAVPCGQINVKLIVALRNFANAPKNVTTIITTYRLKTGSAATFRRSDWPTYLTQWKILAPFVATIIYKNNNLDTFKEEILY